MDLGLVVCVGRIRCAGGACPLGLLLLLCQHVELLFQHSVAFDNVNVLVCEVVFTPGLLTFLLDRGTYTRWSNRQDRANHPFRS